MDKDNVVSLLEKAFFSAKHAFRLGKPIAKGYTFVSNDKPFDPLNVEYDYFSKEHLDTLNVMCDAVSDYFDVGAIQVAKALQEKGVTAYDILETKHFFTMLFARYLQSMHTVEEMELVNKIFDNIYFKVSRFEESTPQPTESESAPETMPESSQTTTMQPTESEKQKEVFPSLESYLDECVKHLSKEEEDAFLHAKIGRRSPQFVKDWKAKCPQKYSKDYWKNALSKVRKEKREKRKKSNIESNIESKAQPKKPRNR